jgi:hypothetical protein
MRPGFFGPVTAETEIILFHICSIPDFGPYFDQVGGRVASDLCISTTEKE